MFTKGSCFQGLVGAYHMALLGGGGTFKGWGFGRGLQVNTDITLNGDSGPSTPSSSSLLLPDHEVSGLTHLMLPQ